MKQEKQEYSIGGDILSKYTDTYLHLNYLRVNRNESEERPKDLGEGSVNNISME